MKAIVSILALCVAVPTSAQVPCPVRQDPVAAMSIFYNGWRIIVDSCPIIDEIGYRYIAEFDVPDIISGRIRQANIVIEVSSCSSTGEIGIVRLYTYIGDGTITDTEWFAGVYYSEANVEGWGERTTVTFDVTSALSDAFVAEREFIGFNYRCIDDRYCIYDVYLCLDDGTPVQAVSWGKIKELNR